MTTQTQEYQIRRGRTEIEVPHLDGNLTFVYDKHGPDTYAYVANSIEESGLRTPTMAETSSLVHTAFMNDEPEFDEIKSLMRNRWLWAFTGTLYTPKGAYIQDNPEIRDNMPFMEESELVKKLEENDSSVRFVDFGYKTGEMTSLKLAENPYVIALAGEEEGAEKLVEVAEEHRYDPKLWSFESVDSPLTRVSALDSDWDVDDLELVVVGYVYGGDGWDGYAFGVQKTE